jgi:hypothetical protein
MPPNNVPSPPIVVNQQGVVAGDVKCAVCSYNLRGLPIESRCTTCGTRIAVSLAGRTADEVHCRGCSYNLRGLPLDAKCPECGTEVAISLQGDLLRYSPPWWLDRLIAGALLICCALSMDAFLVSPRNLLQMNLRPLQRAVVLASSVLGFAGTWLLTSRDSAGQESRRVVWTRAIARFGLAMVVVRGVILSLGNSLFPKLSALVALGVVVAAVARVAGELARLDHLVLISPRTGEQKVARMARILCCIYVPAIAVSVIPSSLITFVLMALTQRSAWLKAAFSTMFLPMAVGFVFTLLCSVFYVLMLIILAIDLWGERRIATTIRAKARSAAQETSSSAVDDSCFGGGASGS